MGETADVVIIGAGVIGCSIAYHLTMMGCSNVIVLEKDYIGSGSTENCPGGVRQQFSTEINIRLSVESIRFFERFEDETGYPADFRQNGYLILATSPEEMEVFRQNVELQLKLGVGVYLLSPQEAKEAIPQLNIQNEVSKNSPMVVDFHNGFWFRREGQVPGVDGLFLACGFSGHGFMHSPAIGRLMAEHILGRGNYSEISPLKLSRFSGKASSKEKCFI